MEIFKEGTFWYILLPQIFPQFRNQVKLFLTCMYIRVNIKDESFEAISSTVLRTCSCFTIAFMEKWSTFIHSVAKAMGTFVWTALAVGEKSIGQFLKCQHFWTLMGSKRGNHDPRACLSRVYLGLDFQLLYSKLMESSPCILCNQHLRYI